MRDANTEYTFLVICKSTMSITEVDAKLGEFVSYVNKEPFGRGLGWDGYTMMQRLPTKGIYSLYGPNYKYNDWLDDNGIYDDDMRSSFQQDYTIIINKDVYKPTGKNIKLKSLIREININSILNE